MAPSPLARLIGPPRPSHDCLAEAGGMHFCTNSGGQGIHFLQHPRLRYWTTAGASASLRSLHAMAYRLIDLFAGCGGMTRGFVDTGHFQPTLAVESDANAAATYAANFGVAHVHAGS